MYLEIGKSINSGIVAYGSPVEFSFTDDPQWRTAITNVIVSSPTNDFVPRDWISTAQINYENIKLAPYLVVHGPKGLLTFTIKATGYADTSVTVTVQ
ncbi:hemoblobin-interacting domain-containing protein [Lysinibacillus sp. 54212]|uniref:hemoblobin-interacting domain-containing protein n=1 Tax=Lysinibacillus sp. 54212 TaxID=3119829 RepID=UPI003FA53A2A